MLVRSNGSIFHTAAVAWGHKIVCTEVKCKVVSMLSKTIPTDSSHNNSEKVQLKQFKFIYFAKCSTFHYHGYAVRKISGHWLTLCCITMVSNGHWSHIGNYSDINSIYKISILKPLSAKLEYFYIFDTCRAKNWPLTFLSITTKWYTIDTCRANCTVSESLKQKKSVGSFWQHGSNFEFDLCTNYLVTPRLPVQDVTQQQYEILIHGSILT